MRRLAFTALVLFAVLLGGAQLWSSFLSSRLAAELTEAMSRIPPGDVAAEKLRQELVSLRLQNEDASSFPSTLTRNLSVVIALIATISGTWVAFHQYLRVRTRERLDRAAMDLSTLWEGLSSSEQEKRAGSVAGFADFLVRDKEDFHDRAVSALALVGRMNNNNRIVLRTLTPLAESAMRHLPASARAVSWQGVSLFRPVLANIDLSAFDFRDAQLGEASFVRALLQNARFDNANLVGAIFDDADLTGANLRYADLARATMRRTNLQGADLRNIRLLDLDLEDADLRGARFAPHATDWRLAKNWRTARIDEPLRDQLLATYGPPVFGTRVAMLMWEFPPFVSGGGWTAAYHFLRALRRRGADIVVFVPMPMTLLDRYLFGNDIELIGVGPESTFSSLVEHSAYALPSSTYSEIRTVAQEYQYGYAGSSLLKQVENFRLRLLRTVDERRVQFDVIHAHDWLTFEAARALSEASGKPWIAHFHSTESDRQPGRENRLVARIEAVGARESARVVTVSEVTKRRVQALYGSNPDRMTVVPNCLSDIDRPSDHFGTFESKQVVFLGRLTRQKGVERFVDIARQMGRHPLVKSFVMYGDGEDRAWVSNNSSYVRREIPAPLVVPPASAKDVEIGGRTLGVTNIATVLDNGVVLPTDPEQVAPLKKEILLRGFTASPLEGSTYSHRLTLPPNSDGLHREYYVISNVFPRTRTIEQRFVELRGALPWDRRTEAFDRASVVIVPSRFEPFGLVVLEAMRHGVPVMFPREAGVAEVIDAGITFDPDDTPSAVTIVEALLSRSDYWNEIVEAQFQAIEKYETHGFEQRLQQIWDATVS